MSQYELPWLGSSFDIQLRQRGVAGVAGKGELAGARVTQRDKVLLRLYVGPFLSTQADRENSTRLLAWRFTAGRG